MAYKTTRKRVRAVGAAILAVSLAVSCGGGGGGGGGSPPPPPPPPPTGNRPPAFNSSASISIAENTKSAGVISASDADGDPVTISVAGGADASLFSFNSTTGALVLRPCAVNFESPGDANADNVYEVTMAASDGKATTSQQLRITVTNALEPSIGNGLVLRLSSTVSDTGSFSSGGDIDCDGFPETMITSGYSIPFSGMPFAYDTYIFFGETLRSARNGIVSVPSTLGAAGGGAIVRVSGAEKASPDWRTASFAGDVDGDGLGDLILASPNRDRAYVVFGDTVLRARNGVGSIDLSTMRPGADGVIITGVNRIVSGLGDADGDGLDDIAFGGRFAGDRTYVVFGAALKAERSLDGAMTATQLAGSGAGVEMTWQSHQIQFNNTDVLAPAGDVDGDGLADLAIGAVGASDTGYYDGEAFIVLGAALKAAASVPGALDLTQIEKRGQGMHITASPNLGGFIGSAIAGVGRLDGDAFGEIVVGAPGMAVNSQGGAGQVAVIRGARLRASMLSQSPVSWASLSTDGSSLVVKGIEYYGVGGPSSVGWAAAPAGDVDGDNLPDIIIGAPLKTNNPPSDVFAGSAYLIFGSAMAGRTLLDLAAIPSSSVAVEIVANRGDGTGNLPDLLYMGGMLAPVGDIDGDGLDEVAIGALPEDADLNGAMNRVARSGVFIVSGARLSQVKALGGFVRLRDMIQ